MDSCTPCPARGNMRSCLATPCNTRSSWFAQSLLSEVGLSVLRGDDLEKPNLKGIPVVNSRIDKGDVSAIPGLA